MLLAARPYNLQVPTGYDGGFAVPLVVLLHGYGASGAQQSAYFQFPALANSQTFLLATPDGTIDVMANRFWNATNACCDIYGTGVDDVKYLTAVMDDASLRYRVDPKRVYFVGHSNGGFMSHRMACDRSNRIAAVVSLAGANFKSLALCQPTQPVSVLQVHGTADGTVAFDGGTFGGLTAFTYPGAAETVQGWATKNGCTGTLAALSGTMDLDTAVAGAETQKAAYSCTSGAAELWTMQSSGHIPTFNASWATSVWTFLQAHPKP